MEEQRGPLLLLSLPSISRFESKNTRRAPKPINCLRGASQRARRRGKGIEAFSEISTQQGMDDGGIGRAENNNTKASQTSRHDSHSSSVSLYRTFRTAALHYDLALLACPSREGEPRKELRAATYAIGCLVAIIAENGFVFV